MADPAMLNMARTRRRCGPTGGLQANVIGNEAELPNTPTEPEPATGEAVNPIRSPGCSKIPLSL